METRFLAGAEPLGMCQLKGHRSLKVSICNAMMLEGATALIDYMKAFEKNIQHKIERFDTNID